MATPPTPKETRKVVNKLLKRKETTFHWACRHFRYMYNKSRLLEDYRLLYSFYVACTAENSSKRKADDCKCGVENCETNRTRVHACLSCVYFGCFVDIEDSHIFRHSQEERHYLAMNTDSGYVFCFQCKDYKYDFRFEKIAQRLRLIASRQQKSKTSFTTCKWQPNKHELYFLKQHQHRVVYDSRTDSRGMENLEVTVCAFISVVQALIHAPVFRDYLLSDKHNCKFKNRTDYPCSICEMTKIAVECFSGESEPFLIISFLAFLKERAPTYAAKKHFDTYDIYQSLIKLFLEDYEGSSPESNIISSMFHISYHKEYKCNSCGKITVLAEKTESEICLYTEGGRISLIDCWKRSELNSICCSSNECSKSDGIINIIPKKLPVVLCFNLEQPDLFVPPTLEAVLSMNRKRKKKEKVKEKEKNFIEFKEFLYMSPENIEETSENRYEDEILKNPEYQYYLFGVVKYCIQHYTVYIRKDKNNWFDFNCDEVKPETLETVLGVQARMLFYHKMFV